MILVAVGTRPPVLNAVPWQTAVVALAETFPGITETLLASNPGLIGTQDAAPAPALAPPAPAAQPPPVAPPAEPEPATAATAEAPAAETFDAAIEPVRRRMERVRLREEFIRELLRDGSVLDANEVALQWAGMPNKNERAVTIAVLDALADGGFLARNGDTYRVLRVPE